MNPTTIQTKHRTKANTGPLRIFHPTIAAFVIAGEGFYDGLIAGGHLDHGWMLCLFREVR